MQDSGKNIDQILRIIRAGGGVTFDASVKNPARLEEVAKAAAKAGVTVTMLNLGDRQTEKLERIARAGRGRVVFAV
jgi:predicted kinase